MKIRTNDWPRHAPAQLDQTWSATGVARWLIAVAFLVGFLVAG